MGVDIHMEIIDSTSGKVLVKNMLQGIRNSDFFNAISNGNSYEYPRWNTIMDYVECFKPDREYDYNDSEVIDAYNKKWGYDFRYITVADFCDWYNETKPGVDAGWIRTYDAWRYRRFGDIPEDPIRYFDREDLNIKDFVFTEYNFETLFDDIYRAIINNNKVAERDLIIYCFDC